MTHHRSAVLWGLVCVLFCAGCSSSPEVQQAAEPSGGRTDEIDSPLATAANQHEKARKILRSHTGTERLANVEHLAAVLPLELQFAATRVEEKKKAVDYWSTRLDRANATDSMQKMARNLQEKAEADYTAVQEVHQHMSAALSAMSPVELGTTPTVAARAVLAFYEETRELSKQDDVQATLASALQAVKKDLARAGAEKDDAVADSSRLEKMDTEGMDNQAIVELNNRRMTAGKRAVERNAALLAIQRRRTILKAALAILGEGRQ